MTTLGYHFSKANELALLPLECGGLLCQYTVATPFTALLEVQRAAGSLIELQLTDVADIQKAQEQLYGDDASQAAEAAGATEDLSALAETAAEIDDLLNQSENSPVVRLINALLLEAIQSGASDIHFDVEEKRLLVRFRIDGVLRDVLEPRRALAANLVSRIKVMAKLDISEKRVPQDGRVSLRVGEHELDVRVSTLPAQFGERVVLRLLNRAATRNGVEHLGMRKDTQMRFESILSNTNGLVLVTGPTGSGKTTTLYAALDRLNDRTRNIVTVEDPIEYSLDGVGQTQVNPGANLSFARALRAILRQDPDIIMVGEIRDSETAKIAVECAMTGHLVLSTLHTNTAIGAITRMQDLGVEAFLLAPMVRGVIAQRLVRRLCPNCAKPQETTAKDVAASNGVLSEGVQIKTSSGCPECTGRGYKGRIALYDVIAVDRALEQAIQSGASEAAMTAQAQTQFGGLYAQGIELVKQGLTSLAELHRVVLPEEPEA